MEKLYMLKRQLLSLISKIFYPCGIIGPYVLFGKIIFQEIQSLGLDQDDELSQDIRTKFIDWFTSKSAFDDFSIGRAFFPGRKWKELSNLEIHTFGDASESGFGACVYFKSVHEGEVKVFLVMSKNRVAPFKKVTLPRLQLLAARLTIYVMKALRLANDPIF